MDLLSLHRGQQSSGFLDPQWMVTASLGYKLVDPGLINPVALAEDLADSSRICIMRDIVGGIDRNVKFFRCKT